MPQVTLLNAAEDGDIDAIEQVISDKPGIQVDSRDTLGWTPLLWAAYKGHFKVVRRSRPVEALISCTDTLPSHLFLLYHTGCFITKTRSCYLIW